MQIHCTASTAYLQTTPQLIVVRFYIVRIVFKVILFFNGIAIPQKPRIEKMGVSNIALID